ncbi:MAG TPA: S8 family serine peptidase [Tepidisphaeraceae bacterium]|nr:S8 family serine peptidase [Tepidisphaeraceae bacterium]
MKSRRPQPRVELLETRQLLAWSSYAQLVGQDDAATDYSSITGRGVTVALIDTGIDYTQPSLGGGFGSSFKVIGGYDFYGNDADPMDETGHGTAVAGVIAANPYTVNGITYQGVAPDAKLVALRVGTASNISNANIEKALQWVIDNYSTYHIGVVNLSLGSGNYTTAQSDPTMGAEFKQLHDLGIFVVAASGNSNDQQSGPISQDGIAYPAADPNVFAVGAVDSNDIITTWAQRGSELDLLAPGVDIVMPQLGGGFVTEDGTSFASPYVAGTAALLKQADSSLKAGDIGSILMSSATVNRDGDNETGNTTGLLFGRLNIDAALKLTTQRASPFSTLKLTNAYDMALDSQGVLHAAYYDPVNHDLLYATRSTSGKWSAGQIVDSAGDVGMQVSIAVDATGKAGIAYFDATNADMKYASFDGLQWHEAIVESNKFVGTSPSLAFTIDGDAYLAYYRKTGGYLRLAHLDRDTGRWGIRTVDGGTGANVGAVASLAIGEVPVRSGFFTTYDTTIAIAYADVTNGDLKYARLDVDDPTATWYLSLVSNTRGVAYIDLHLHAGPLNLGVQAQIAYLDVANHQIKYAYRNTDWFTETVVTGTQFNSAVQLSFDASDRPAITYYNSVKKAIYTSTRRSSTSWATVWNATSLAATVVSYNDRTGQTLLTWMTRSKTDVDALELT